MITLELEMTQVNTCNQRMCAYNKGNACHARAITIGDGLSPMCDTFFISKAHCNDTSHLAGVGACKVSACTHNSDFECQAELIDVAVAGGEVKCMTFAM